MGGRSSRRGRGRWFAVLVVLAVAAAACSSGGGDDRADPDTGETGEKGRGGIERVDLDSRSLSEAGRRLARRAGLEAAPVYDLSAVVQPETGRVEGSLIAELPPGRDPMRFRVFPALPALATNFRFDRVEVEGEDVEPALDRSLLTLARPTGASERRVKVRLDFAYTVGLTDVGDDLFGALAGGDLEPPEIGLLGRHEGGLALGHWFPVWIAPGGRDDPDPQGFGDIANFPAALISAKIEVPEEWKLFSGAVTTDRRTDRGRTVYSEEGAGLRDLSVYVGRTVDVREVQAGETTVRVVSQAADAGAAADVGREASDALSALGDAFGPYPWSELDVVDVPLGSGVGGMEWPGAVWISQSFFAGGLPGLGGLEGLSGLQDLLGRLGDAEGLGESLGGLGGLLDPTVLGSLRAFVIAHEVGHEWWHALVGNDSIAAPVVDEPLAQFSACVTFRARAPEEAGRVCAFNTVGQYRTLRALGEPDARADQPTTDFASSRQYGAVVYGKAPELFERLRSLLGEETMRTALRRYAEANAFKVATPDRLRAALVDAAPSRATEIEGLWRRWMEEAHGDEDLGTEGGGPEALGSLGLGGPEQVTDLLTRLLQGLGGD